MHRLLRRCLIGMLAMALVVAGSPLAHAMPCAPTVQSAHQHADMATASEVGHAHHHDMARSGETPQPQDDQHPSATPCKCLNCSLCVTTLVAPFMRDVTPERRSLAVRYDIFASGDRRAFVFIDPGIPILAA